MQFSPVSCFFLLLRYKYSSHHFEFIIFLWQKIPTFISQTRLIFSPTYFLSSGKAEVTSACLLRLKQRQPLSCRPTSYIQPAVNMSTRIFTLLYTTQLVQLRILCISILSQYQKIIEYTSEYPNYTYY
jgi:hypothetical protein